ncbi:cytochrome P450 [Earliella scabrosa]|nr:cytochrome P450 [Earliella scabrosa]
MYSTRPLRPPLRVMSLSSLLMPPLDLFSLQNIALILLAASALIVVKRLFFHPLASFPGPKLAAASWWYMTYYEVFKDGAFVDHLETLHEIYGPVIRISPDQLHFCEPSAYDDIYLHGHRFTKDPRVYQGKLSQDNASLCIVDLREIKTRRDILGPLFSRRAIVKLEHVILSKIDRLLEQLGHYAEAEKPANIRRACRSTALELIYAYCFATHEDFVTAPDFSHRFVVESELTFPLFHWYIHFPGCTSFFILKSLDKIHQLREHPELVEHEEHETVLQQMLIAHPDKGQTGIPSEQVLWEEAITLIAAGSETVASVVNVGVFHVLNNPDIHAKLVEELKCAWPELETTMRYDRLEKLPYLTAVIKESLRLAHGVVLPLPRIVGPKDAIIAGHTVPAGTVVSMGASFVHLNSTIFPQPHDFIPERWLEPKDSLDNHLVAFSKGPRTCLGINLGWCELYLFFGYLFRKLDMELYNTTPNAALQGQGPQGVEVVFLSDLPLGPVTIVSQGFGTSDNVYIGALGSGWPAPLNIRGAGCV